MTNQSSTTSKALRPRARILRTLGEELISSETVAVLELVKNSYDADAGYVLIRFEQSLEENDGVLRIEDNGHGMDLATIERSWMEPATIHKKKIKSSTFLHRRLLGEKGVGRFATARLAKELELSTRPPGSSAEVFAVFDWTQFDNEDLYLDEVLILAEEREPQDFVTNRELPSVSPAKSTALVRDGSHGTLLRMPFLKRTWNERDIKDLKRGLSRLISPFEEDRDFRIFLQLPDQNAGKAQELEPPEVINYPHYTIEGAIDSKGSISLKIELHATGEREIVEGRLSRSRNSLTISDSPEISPDENAVECGPLYFQIMGWDRDQLDNIEQKLGSGIRNIRKDLDSVAGISIYRDGFRVLPYGEPENDWLKLDLRRVQNPTLRLSNNQITGYIKISADTNPLLKDQSNREGLDNNQAYRDLQSVMILALSEIETRRFREKKTRQVLEKPADRERGLFDAPDTAALRARLQALGSDPEALRLLEGAARDWESQIVRVKEVIARYHSLATVGQLVDKIVHDGRQPLSTVQTQASLALDAVKRAEKSADLEPGCQSLLISLSGKLDRIKNSAELIDLLLKRIEPLGGRRRGRPSKVYLRSIVEQAISQYETDIENLGIKISLPSSDELVQVDSSEIQEVFINLVGNSVYWLQKVPQDQRAILVEFERPQPGQMVITYADSGPGVPKLNRSSIFEPYFSTKPDGMGLGLAISGEIIREYYNGSLELLNSGPLPGVAFRITLNKRV